MASTACSKVLLSASIEIGMMREKKTPAPQNRSSAHWIKRSCCPVKIATMKAIAAKGLPLAITRVARPFSQVSRYRRCCSAVQGRRVVFIAYLFTQQQTVRATFLSQVGEDDNSSPWLVRTMRHLGELVCYQSPILGRAVASFGGWSPLFLATLLLLFAVTSPRHSHQQHP